MGFSGPASQTVVGNQVRVSEPLACHARYHESHLLDRVGVPHVVASSELGHVPVQVLRADLVEGAEVSPFEQGPKRFNTVRMRLPPDILTNRVTHSLMIRERMVSQSVIGVNLGSGLHVLHDETAHGLGLGIRDNRGRYVLGGSIFDPCHGGLPNSSTSCQFLPLLVAHVLPLPAHVRLISFYGAGEAAGVYLCGLAQPCQHEPCGPLADPQFPVEPHGGHTLDVRHEQVDAHGPDSIGELGPFHDRPLTDREHGPLRAVSATVGHRLVLDVALDIERSAGGTMGTIRPSPLFDPLQRVSFVPELVRDLEQRESLPMGLSRCLLPCHLRPLPVPNCDSGI